MGGKIIQSVAANHGEPSPTLDYIFYTQLWGKRRCWEGWCWEGLLSHRRCVVKPGKSN